MCSEDICETSVCKHICANRKWQPRRYMAVSPPVSAMTHLAQISPSLNYTLMSSQLSAKKGAKLLTSANLLFSWLGRSARSCLDNWLQLLIQQGLALLWEYSYMLPNTPGFGKQISFTLILLSACPCVFVESGFLLYNQSPAGFRNWASR